MTQKDNKNKEKKTDKKDLDIQDQILNDQEKDSNEKKDKDPVNDKKEEKSQIKKGTKKKTKKDTKKTPENFKEKYEIINDKYLRLTAEFDNYRKRTLKERMELMKNAGEDILINFLPVMDNIDRAKNSVDDAKDIDAVKEGIVLIHKNLFDFLKERGIKEIESIGEVFDTDLHEAITKIPAPEEKLKGKVVDVIEKGYKMRDKVLRYAKVVVGE